VDNELSDSVSEFELPIRVFITLSVGSSSDERFFAVLQRLGAITNRRGSDNQPTRGEFGVSEFQGGIWTTNWQIQTVGTSVF